MPLQILENIDVEVRILSVGLLRAPQKNPIDSENELNIVKLIPTVPPCVQIHFLILSTPQPFICASEAFQPWKLIHPKTSLASLWTLEKLILLSLNSGSFMTSIRKEFQRPQFRIQILLELGYSLSCSSTWQLRLSLINWKTGKLPGEWMNLLHFGTLMEKFLQKTFKQITLTWLQQATKIYIQVQVQI